MKPRVTQTGNFQIGFRRLNSDWHKDLDGLIEWSKEQGFGVMDLLRVEAPETIRKVLAAGMQVGSVDLLEWQKMISPDATTRKDAVQRNTAHIEACSALGPTNYFLVMLPEKSDLKPGENFRYMIETFQQLIPVLEKTHSKIVIEGWPGPGSLCCTPEAFRLLFKECPSSAMGINYDPSHLIRMGIDAVRFLREFLERVFHVHGKDAEILNEALYDFGTQLPAIQTKSPRFSGTYWRYTLPGFGSSDWTAILEILLKGGYKGHVSIELEDAKFVGNPDLEKDGLLRAAWFLQTH